MGTLAAQASTAGVFGPFGYGKDALGVSSASTDAKGERDDGPLARESIEGPVAKLGKQTFAQGPGLETGLVDPERDDLSIVAHRELDGDLARKIGRSVCFLAQAWRERALSARHDLLDAARIVPGENQTSVSSRRGSSRVKRACDAPRPPRPGLGGIHLRDGDLFRALRRAKPAPHPDRRKRDAIAEVREERAALLPRPGRGQEDGTVPGKPDQGERGQCGERAMEKIAAPDELARVRHLCFHPSPRLGLSEVHQEPGKCAQRAPPPILSGHLRGRVDLSAQYEVLEALLRDRPEDLTAGLEEPFSRGGGRLSSCFHRVEKIRAGCARGKRSKT